MSKPNFMINKNVYNSFNYLGFINLRIAGGDDPMKKYIQLYHGHSDYNPIDYTNFENAFGFLATSTHVSNDSMQFDMDTRAILYNENKLKKLRFVYW